MSLYDTDNDDSMPTNPTPDTAKAKSAKKPDDDSEKDKVKKGIAGITKAAQVAAVDYKPVPIYHKGGIVKNTGPAIMKKGELVIPTEKVAKVRAMMRNSGSMKSSDMKNAKNSVSMAGRTYKTADERGLKIAGADGKVHDNHVKEYSN